MSPPYGCLASLKISQLQLETLHLKFEVSHLHLGNSLTSNCSSVTFNQKSVTFSHSYHLHSEFCLQIIDLLTPVRGTSPLIRGLQLEVSPPIIDLLTPVRGVISNHMFLTSSWRFHPKSEVFLIQLEVYHFQS